MATTKPIRERIQALKEEYARIKKGKDSLLTLLDEAELPEAVYNSNAIENSTLTLKETERILLEQEVDRDVSVREVFEAKNLARVSEYIRTKALESEISKDTMLLLHQMLIGGINDSIAGRFRREGEYVRIGTHVAPAPEHLERMLESLLTDYANDHESYDLDAIARFHLEFEHIHPFNDGNGRIGRVLINWQLLRHGFPSIIIRDKEKQVYYRAFGEYRDSQKKRSNQMERVLTLTLMESLHKRLAYLHGGEIVTLAAYAKQKDASLPALTNAARRQTIPAFRERGVWKIESKFVDSRSV